MNISNEDFIAWGTKAGLPAEVLGHLVEYALTPDEIREKAVDGMMSAPPIYPLGKIQAMREEDPGGIIVRRAGFLVIGSCPNGDPVAVDVSQQPGTVWYLSHEEMFEKDLRSVAVKVASNIPTFWQSLTEDDAFPIDYWAAHRGEQLDDPNRLGEERQG